MKRYELIDDDRKLYGVATYHSMVCDHVLVIGDYGMWQMKTTVFVRPRMTFRASMVCKPLGEYISSGPE